MIDVVGLVQGGSYSAVRNSTNRPGYEIHHMPADSISPLSTSQGPAIRMTKKGSCNDC
ncbi:MAG: hypothetical protein IPP71_09525 [Bacteroidetes bacterium]|nr:hypothetical protein [Bacteroidota bacterium]